MHLQRVLAKLVSFSSIRRSPFLRRREGSHCDHSSDHHHGVREIGHLSANSVRRAICGQELQRKAERIEGLT
jgi:hypothetical protein